jgi:serine/threonine-protein kinase HipA
MADPVEVHSCSGTSAESGTILAGSLWAHRRRTAESASFAYAENYLGSPSGYALDPGLALRAGIQQTRNGQALFAAFSDSAPDRWGRNLIKRLESKRAQQAGTAVRSLSEIDFLLGVRDDLRQGALRFRSTGDGPFLAEDDLRVPALAELPALLDLAARAESDDAGYEELRRLVRDGSSLGGARPKAHVLDVNGKAAIAKFPSPASDDWDVMAWEKVALDLARSAGIRVPDSTLLRIGGRSVLVVDRFDRRGDVRLGYVSALTMLEAADGEQRSYLDIAAIIEQHSTDTTTELRELWRRIAFSVLISNTDDHLRNHGFLHAGGDSWALSPAFDLNPNPEPGTTYLSTAIDEHDTTATLDNVRAVAEYFRLDAAAGERVLVEVLTAVRGWRDLARRQGLSERECQDMAPAFRRADTA